MIKQQIRFSDPACYNLSIKGELSREALGILSNFFEGRINCEYVNKITHLEGVVKDQIALSGLLGYLCDLHYILLSVKTINKPNTEIQQ